MGNNPWKNPNKIHKIQIIGERCSGTNFLFHLIKQNVKIPVQDHIIWKHGFFSQPYPNSEQILFIHVYRNIYDYLRSLYRTPHNCARYLRRLSFSDWIRNEWSSTEEIANTMYYDLDLEGKPFPNVIQMRNAKVKHFCNLVENQLVKFCISISYEEVGADPQKFLHRIREQFGIWLQPVYTPVDTYKGINHVQFVPQKYFPLKSSDIHFINEQIHWKEWEEPVLHYQKQDKVDFKNWTIPLLIHHPAPNTRSDLVENLCMEWKRLHPDFTYHYYTVKEQKEYLNLHDKDWKSAPDLSLLFGLTKVEKEGGYYVNPHLQPMEPLDRYISPEDQVVIALTKQFSGLQYQCLLFGAPPQPNVLDLYTSIFTQYVEQNTISQKHVHLLSPWIMQPANGTVAFNWTFIRE